MAVTTRMLEISSVSHVFNGEVVVENISLQVAPGEIVSIVGPSGCGKTTLLRIAAGLLAPTRGTVRLSAGRIGFVFQDPALLPWQRVQENAALFASDADREFVETLLERTGLSSHRQKWPYELSGGMKMRTSLVRTLSMRPSVVLADEPFGALDQMTRQNLQDELLTLHSHQAFTVLLVTHAIDEAVYLSDRVITMSTSPGRFITSTPVAFQQPRNPDLRYSAEFAALCGSVADSLRRTSR